MPADRHRRAADLFVAAARQPAADRGTFLDRECADDAALRAEVESLLAHDPGEESERFGDAPLPSVGELLTLAGNRMPAQIGPYRVVGVLGRGGMGLVYRARQEHPAREVAVKVLAAGASTEGSLKRFVREAQALGRLQHPGIAQIHEAGTADTGGGPQPYFAMELVEGSPITEFAAQYALDLRARLELVILVCRALDHAHQRGVVHRDLKPANILVDRTGQPKVLDFGVARLLEEDAARTAERTAAGDVLGTIAYMSPEQAAGDHSAVDARTDVHALGVVAYELLCGEAPRNLAGRSVAGMLAAVASEPTVPLARRAPRLRGDLDTIVGKALATDPRRRYATAAELAADLRRYLDHEPVSARRPSAIYRTRMLVRRHRGMAAGLLLAILVLLAGAATSVAWALRAEANARRADEERRSADHLSAFLEQLLAAAAPAVARGQTVTARDLVARGHDSALRETGESAGTRGRIMSLLGQVERSMGETARAAEILPLAVAELRRASAGRGPDPRLADALHSLGELRHDEGRHDEAEALLGEALELRTRLSGRDSAAAAECVHALGVLAGVRGLSQDAIRLQTEAAATFEQRLGGKSPRLAMALESLGTHLNALLRHDQAAEHLERAVAILQADGEASLGRLAGALGNLAITRIHQQRARDAGPLFRRALAIGEQIYPKDHPALIVPLTNFGAFYFTQGRAAQAEPLLERALAIHGEHQVGDRRAAAHAHLTLGSIQEQEGQWDAAAASYEKSAALFQRLAGPEYLNLSTVRESQGRLAYRRGQPAAALEAFREALSMREQVLGQDHAALRSPLQGIAECHDDLGQEAERDQALQRIQRLH